MVVYHVLRNTWRKGTRNVLPGQSKRSLWTEKSRLFIQCVSTGDCPVLPDRLT